MVENKVAKPFSMLEFGTYTAGVGLLLSFITKYFIAPHYPDLVEHMNILSPLLTPVISYAVALLFGRYGTTPSILRMNRDIDNSITRLRRQIEENEKLLPKEDMDRLKRRLAEYIDLKSQIGISIHSEQELSERISIN